MAIEIGTVNADTSVKLGATAIQSGYIGFKQFYNTYISILDLYPSVYHAYSLRKLRSGYTGACLRIRRTTASPNPVTTTTVDLSFDVFNTISFNSPISNQTGTATAARCLGEFCAAPGYINRDGVVVNQNIFVVTWYDQSGNNKNPTQADPSNQPRLVSGGSLEIVDGTVGIRFTAAPGNYLDVADTSTSYDNMSCYVVGNSLSATVSTSIYGQGHLGNNARLFLPQGTGIAYDTNGTFPITGITANVDRLYQIICGASTTSAYSNGVQSSVLSVPSLSVTNAYIRIGANGVPLTYMNGHVKEVICLVGTPDRVEIGSNVMDYYGIQKPPLVTTANVNYIEPTGTAAGGGNLISEYGLTPTTKGVCWNTFQPPTIDSGAVTNDGTGEGAFTSSLNFLSAYTTYYVRAYATNSVGTTYGEEKQFTTGAAPASLMLDLFPSAHHAYSLRKLRTAYGGFCLRIRRTTAAPNPITTTTVDLAFDGNGTISFSSAISPVSGPATNAVNLGQFAQGTVDGLTAQSVINVVTWYDQSGNNKNVTNTTVARHPRLVRLDAGVATLETSGGKPAIRFDRPAINFLQIAETTANIGNMSSYWVGQFVTTVGNQVGYGLSGSGGNRYYFPYSSGSNISAGYDNSPTAILYQSGSSTDRKLFELLAPSPLDSSVAQGWMNGIAKTTEPITSAASVIIQVGVAGTNYYDGYIQEVIGYQSNTYRGEKEMNINVYWQVY